MAAPVAPVLNPVPARGLSATADRLATWAIGCAALLLYLPRLPRQVSAWGDSPELATAAALWGVPHPPGYPLLTLLGHVATLVPIGSPAWRMHATSALFHALCVVLMLRVVRKGTGRLAAGAFAAIFLALSRSFFLGSLYFESFPLNDLLCLLLLDRAQSLGDWRPGSSRFAWFTLGGALGLAAAHHQTSVLYVPAVVWLAWSALRRAGAREALALTLALLVTVGGCLSLLWIAAQRQTGANWGTITDLSSLWSHATREQFGGLLSANARSWPWQPLRRQLVHAMLVVNSLGWLGIAALTVAIGRGFRERNRLVMALALTALLTGPVFFGLNRVSLAREENWAWAERFSTLGQLPLVALVGLGADYVVRWLPGAYRLVGGYVGAACMLGLLARSLPELDLSGDASGQRLAEDIVNETEPNSVVVLNGDLLVWVMEYHCLVENSCGRRVVMPLHRRAYMRVRLAEPSLALPLLDPEQRVFREGLRALLRAAVGRRPVAVSPQLLSSHPEWHDEYTIVPGLVLLHLYPKGASPQADWDRLSGSAAECHGCREPIAHGARPTMHAQTLGIYGVGLENLISLGLRAGTSGPLLERLSALRRVVGRPPFHGWVEQEEEPSAR